MTCSFWSNRKSYLLIITFLTALGMVLRFLALNQTHYANGWDGYYYVMQAHSWIEYGHLQSMDFSIVYPFYTLISYAIGDYELAFKVGSTVISGLLMGAAALLVYEVRKEVLPVLLVMSLLCFSPLLTYLVAQFPKNVMGFSFLMGFLLMLHKRSLWGCLILFLLTILTHRMTAGLCLIVMVVYGTQYLSRRWIAAALLVALLLSFLPGIFHWSDLQRMDGMFSIWPQLAPWSFYRLFEPAWNYWWGTEVLLLTGLLAMLSYHYVTHKLWQHEDFLIRWCLPLMIAISWFPFMLIEHGSLGYRFFLVAPICLITYLALLIPIAYYRVIVRASSLGVVAGLMSYRSYQPRFHDPQNQVYELIAERLKSAYSPQVYPLVVVHKSLAEMIIYKTDFDALNWAPPEFAAPTALRITHGVAYVHFSKYLRAEELQTVKKLTLNYYAISETLWSEFVDRIVQQNDQALMQRIYNKSNPMQPLPDYLVKSKHRP